MPTPVRADASQDIEISSLRIQDQTGDGATQFSVRLDSQRFLDFWIELDGECDARQESVKITRAVGRIYHFEKQTVQINPAAIKGQDRWIPKCNGGSALDGVIGEKCEWLTSQANPSESTHLRIPLRHSSTPDFQVDLHLSIPETHFEGE